MKARRGLTMRTGKILAGLLISIAALAAFPQKSEAKLSSKDLYKQFQNPDSQIVGRLLNDFDGEFIAGFRRIKDEFRNHVASGGVANRLGKRSFQLGVDHFDRSVGHSRGAGVGLEMPPLAAFAPTGVFGNIDQVVRGFASVAVAAVPRSSL